MIYEQNKKCRYKRDYAEKHFHFSRFFGGLVMLNQDPHTKLVLIKSDDNTDDIEVFQWEFLENLEEMPA